MSLEQRKARLIEIQKQIDILDSEARSLVSIEELMIEKMSQLYDADVPQPIHRTQSYIADCKKSESVDMTIELLKKRNNLQ